MAGRRWGTKALLEPPAHQASLLVATQADCKSLQFKHYNQRCSSCVPNTTTYSNQGQMPKQCRLQPMSRQCSMHLVKLTQHWEAMPQLHVSLHHCSIVIMIASVLQEHHQLQCSKLPAALSFTTWERRDMGLCRHHDNQLKHASKHSSVLSDYQSRGCRH